MAEQPKVGAEVLTKQVVYDGEGYTRQSIEGMLGEYQAKPTVNLKKFEELSGAYQRLSQEMTQDIADNKSAFEYMGNILTLNQIGTNLKGPWLFTRRESHRIH